MFAAKAEKVFVTELKRLEEFDVVDLIKIDSEQGYKKAIKTA